MRGKKPRDAGGAVAFPSVSEAEANATEWLGELECQIGYEWEWVTPTARTSETVRGLPCQVLAFIVPVEGGFAPVFAFTLGTKYETRTASMSNLVIPYLRVDRVM